MTQARQERIYRLVPTTKKETSDEKSHRRSEGHLQQKSKEEKGTENIFFFLFVHIYSPLIRTLAKGHKLVKYSSKISLACLVSTTVRFIF